MTPKFAPPTWNASSSATAANSSAAGNGYQPAVPMRPATPPKDELSTKKSGTQKPSAPTPTPQHQQPAKPNTAAPQYHTQTPCAPSYSAANTQSHQPDSEPSGDYISQKITKINGKDKVIDFNSRLVMANLNDFANIHGCGGSGHAINSTINLTLCDYTKGTGDKSVTVKYSVDVEDMALLYRAAMDARMGNLRPDTASVAAMADALIGQIQTWKSYPATQNKERVIPGTAINSVLEALNGIKGALQQKGTEPLFSYAREKVHSHKVENGYSPVKKLQINYTPLRKDGKASTYPWYISIENFDAPLNRRDNGATTYDGSKAINKHSAFINIGMDDFAAAMVAVNRFIDLWQMRCLPMMNEAYAQLDAQRQQKN